MPTYRYRCDTDGEEFEVWQSIQDDPLTVHDGCGGTLRKVFSPAGIVLKGSGFYKTDSRNGAKRSPTGTKDTERESKDNGRESKDSTSSQESKPSSSGDAAAASTSSSSDSGSSGSGSSGSGSSGD